MRLAALPTHLQHLPLRRFLLQPLQQQVDHLAVAEPRKVTLLSGWPHAILLLRPLLAAAVSSHVHIPGIQQRCQAGCARGRRQAACRGRAASRGARCARCRLEAASAGGSWGEPGSLESPHLSSQPLHPAHDCELHAALGLPQVLHISQRLLQGRQQRRLQRESVHGEALLRGQGGKGPTSELPAVLCQEAGPRNTTGLSLPEANVP